MREKKMKKKRLKQKKIVVLSCFKFCWDSFLILWKTPSFSPHCCWNYYLLLYILLREKSGRGNHISFQATPICWFYDARCWKKKKDFCSALLLSSPVSKFCVTTQKQTNKNHNVEKWKTNVFMTAIVIAVKKLWKLEKPIGTFWQEKNENKNKTRTRKNKTNNPCFTTFFLFIKFGHDDERKQKNCYHYYRYNNTQINYYTL